MNVRKRDKELQKSKDICKSCGTSAIDISASEMLTEDTFSYTGNNTYSAGVPYSELTGQQKKRTAVFSKFPPKRSTIPEGVEYVLYDSDLPPCDNERALPTSSGILYEIADELYRNEQSAARLTADEPPPFKKGFDKKHHEKHFVKTEESIRKPLNTSLSFLIQLMFLIPIFNVIFALYFAFHKNTNLNVKSFSRAFLILCLVFTTVFIVSLMFSSSAFSISSSR